MTHVEEHVHRLSAVTASKADTDAEALDPVCGMSVDPRSAQNRVEHEGAAVYFCGTQCRAKFMADPAKYPASKTSHSAPSMTASPRDVSSPQGPIYTCPMHPQIRLSAPGSCPICGMALEPASGTTQSGASAELIDMTRRFWMGAVLAVPTLILEMGAHVPRLGLHHYVSPQASVWIQFALATPVVLWAGWPFFERGWASERHVFVVTGAGTLMDHSKPYHLHERSSAIALAARDSYSMPS